METVRKPLQGLTNIIRFNWHLYAFSFLMLALMLVGTNFILSLPRTGLVVSVLILFSIIISLTVSWYIYDHSGFYSLNWLHADNVTTGRILNIHAGFDETSQLLQKKFLSAELIVCDFYDPAKHTEPSIRRARKLYPSYNGTISIPGDRLPFADNFFENVFLIFAAHEIRNDEEKIMFFSEIRRIVKENGKVHVVEHLQDLPNFIAFNIGFLHFVKRSTWLKTFQAAGLSINFRQKLNPFVHYFILSKNGTAS